MASQPRVADWRSILLLVLALSGAVFAIIAAIGIFIFMAVNRNMLLELNASPLTSTLAASTLLAIGLLLVPVAWLSLKRLRGTEFDSFLLPSLRLWEWIAIPGLWLLVLTLATLYHDAPGALWYAPVLHFLSIALPVYFVIRLAINRISLGSSQRAWGVFGAGMTLSPLLAVIAEGIVILLGMAVVAIYLGFNPDAMLQIERLIRQVERAPDLDSLIYQVGPFLKHPLTLFAGLAFLSFLVPIIEETAKSLAVWLVADRIRFPAQGFALGALSGAGFALAESLSASLTADDAWAATLAMRAVSGSMHMLASGLAGWGIAQASLENRYFKFAGMMLLAILLHAAWNAGAVFSVWGGARVMLAMPGVDVLGALLAAGGVGLLFFLMAGMFVAFFVLNERLRASSPPDSSPVEFLD
jgi:RsiW-degrading membrane proteinase PrsW (M82 family)